jgi:hypothetical protein
VNCHVVSESLVCSSDAVCDVFLAAAAQAPTALECQPHSCRATSHKLLDTISAKKKKKKQQQPGRGNEMKERNSSRQLKKH